jgi:L-amino acid N-acyltransferase YncA
MPEVTIRKATKNDLTELALMLRRLMLYKRSDLDIDEKVYPIEIYHDILRKNLQKESFIAYIAESEDKILGFISGDISQKDEDNTLQSEILYIFVKKPYRGKGISKMLLESFIEWSKEKGAEEIYVEVGAENEASINLHKKLGFKQKFKWVHMVKTI